ncbi:hypothetical protein Plhal304r1_c026g0087641 [Plasmopara halstedii]
MLPRASPYSFLFAESLTKSSFSLMGRCSKKFLQTPTLVRANSLSPEYRGFDCAANFDITSTQHSKL